ncbi:MULTISPECIES: hypothetical protein [Paenibacillus]|nr:MULTISPECIES: hypothetical protein [Paenibacillus]MBP1307931.1 transcriptional regulator of met regulon [Paenibacillus sp. 1182]
MKKSITIPTILQSIPLACGVVHTYSVLRKQLYSLRHYLCFFYFL